MVRDQPDAEALAQDCAQDALIRIHERLADCREPRAFRTWAKRIVSHKAIDALRRSARQRLFADNAEDDPAFRLSTTSSLPQLDTVVLAEIGLAELRNLLDQAPLSDRSRRVVIGRYLDDIPDETLAQTESALTGQTVRPSHVQVTRAKNIQKLRNWELLSTFFI